MSGTTGACWRGREGNVFYITVNNEDRKESYRVTAAVKAYLFPSVAVRCNSACSMCYSVVIMLFRL